MFAGRLVLVAVLTALSTVSGSGGTVAHNRQPLPFFYDLYTFRGSDGGTAVVSAYAVEAGNLESRPTASSYRYRFSVSLVLVDTALRSISGAHDTVYVDVPRRLAGDHLLYTHVEVRAPPSRNTQQRVIMIDALTPGVGQLYSESFPIPDYSGTRLMLSDIALGQPDAEKGWKRGDVTLALLPTSQFPTSAFDVYYEIYNLPAGHQYTTEIAIERATDSGVSADRQPVRLRFAGVSAAGPDDMHPELRRVETSLSKGSYVITVTITNLTTGTRASQSRPFDVRGWERGATMVAALPHRSGYRASDR